MSSAVMLCIAALFLGATIFSKKWRSEAVRPAHSSAWLMVLACVITVADEYRDALDAMSTGWKFLAIAGALAVLLPFSFVADRLGRHLWRVEPRR